MLGWNSEPEHEVEIPQKSSIFQEKIVIVSFQSLKTELETLKTSKEPSSY